MNPILYKGSYTKEEANPPGMRRRSDVSFRSHIGRDIADHAKTSSRRRNWYVNETDLFQTSLNVSLVRK